MTAVAVKRAAIIWSVFVVFLTGTYTYWMLVDDNPPLVAERFEVEHDSYRAGEPVHLIFDFCKRTDAPPVVAFKAQRVDGGEVYFARVGQPTALEPGCYNRELTIQFLGIAPGEYHLVGSFTYRINPVRERTVTVEAGQPFIITGD